MSELIDTEQVPDVKCSTCNPETYGDATGCARIFYWTWVALVLLLATFAVLTVYVWALTTFGRM